MSKKSHTETTNPGSIALAEWLSNYPNNGFPPPTEALLLRASEIDPQAWASPLPDHLAKRRRESMKRAYAELKAA
jgi:hypothetical protein